MADTQRARYLKRKYGITEAEFQLISNLYYGHCPICDKPFKKTPCVDHDHRPLGTTKAFDGSPCSGQEIRGALCIACNKALGYFWTRDRLLNAWHYMDPNNFTGLFIPQKKKRRKAKKRRT